MDFKVKKNDNIWELDCYCRTATYDFWSKRDGSRAGQMDTISSILIADAKSFSSDVRNASLWHSKL